MEFKQFNQCIERITKEIIKICDLMSLCRDKNDILDCGMCEYEYTDTCSLRLEQIKENKVKKGV